MAQNCFWIDQLTSEQEFQKSTVQKDPLLFTLTQGGGDQILPFA